MDLLSSGFWFSLIFLILLNAINTTQYMKITRTKGFSLIEVLISLLLISLILFGLDAAQIYAIKEAKIAYFFNAAINQINNASERLAVLKMHDGLDQQITTWNAENQTLLPAGFGEIVGEFPHYIITIYWGNAPHHCEKQQIGPAGCLKKEIQLE